ncbi:hypothetical protein HG536_0D02710 [Torulaspora globosa]|uniref:Protein NSG2 n=1 Tax=Torulaspora globosa TaxID=48254 RepID=A0A7G3ZGW3_9SACH|nr:uncharacterized protein HG536_0D02710 [Torulaspora globosa]QLL32749.1 hypothetical protein HG536_0D02710 [Torulaspora globosa]
MAKKSHGAANGGRKLGGLSRSRSDIGAKSTESISNLTRPQLYSLYDEDITKSEDTQVYEEIKRSRGESQDDSGLSLEPGLGFSAGPATSVSLEPRVKKQWWTKMVNFVFAMLLLSIAGISYHELSRHLHDNHLLHPDFASRPLSLGVEISNALTGGRIPEWGAYALEGILFGLAIPLMDYIFKTGPSHNSIGSIIRSVNAMLGVTFGIRKVEWSSSLQAAGAWGLLNIILWLLFDSTKSMFIGCSSLGLLACVSCYGDVSDKSQFLYFMDFYFLGLLLFGKLGRYLFSQ